MPDRLGAAYWRTRAEETRLLAAQMSTERAKLTLLQIAENYDQLAQQAETQERSKFIPT
jgi:hypothetical protein